jgi:hypothetical protein
MYQSAADQLTSISGNWIISPVIASLAGAAYPRRPAKLAPAARTAGRGVKDGETREASEGSLRAAMAVFLSAAILEVGDRIF